MLISSMVGRQMTIFAVIVPFWLLIAFCGWKTPCASGLPRW
jgi:lactate permease